MINVISAYRRCLTIGVHTIRNYTAVQSNGIYEVKPERMQEIAKSPSGWVPRADPSPQLPFDITRTRTNNIPVYIDIKGGGSKIVTTIRKVRGDLKELEKCVRSRLGDDFHYQINELTSQLHIKGNHKDPIVRLLKELGF